MGLHVTGLHIHGFPQPLEQLPLLRNLRELKVMGCQVRLGPGDGQPGVLCSSTGLTRLEVHGDTLDAPQGGRVVDCSTLANVQHLSLHLHLLSSTVGGLSGHTLPPLQRLTHLSVSRLTADNLLQLGGLTALQSLELHAASAPRGEVVIGPSSMRGFVLPASLTKLVVGARVEAALLSVVPTSLRHLEFNRSSSVVEGPADGAGSFLSCMAGLQHLTALELCGGLAWPAPCPAYSALMASTHLVSFTMSGKLPGGIWPFVFPAGHMRPHLTVLNLHIDAPVQPGAAPPSAWGPADLISLVNCCPNVRELDSLAMLHDPHTSALHRLTALTSVEVSYGKGDIDAVEESFSGIAAITQLRRLSVLLGARLGVAHSVLLPLTTLTALLTLECSWCPRVNYLGNMVTVSFYNTKVRLPAATDKCRSKITANQALGMVACLMSFKLESRRVH